MELVCDGVEHKACDDITHMDSSDVIQHSLDDTSISSAGNSIQNDCDEQHPQHGDRDENYEYLLLYCDPCRFSSSFSGDYFHNAASVQSMTASTIDISLLPTNSVTSSDVLSAITNNANNNRNDRVSIKDNEEKEGNELTLYSNTVSMKDEQPREGEPMLITLQAPSLFDQLDIWFEKLFFSSDITNDDSSFRAHAIQNEANHSYWSSVESILASLGSCNLLMMYELEQFGSCCFPTFGPRITTDQPLIITKMTHPRRGSARKQHVVEQLLKERGRAKTSSSLYKLRRVKSFSAVHDTIIHQQKSRRQSKEPPFEFWKYWLKGGSSQNSPVVASSHAAADEDGYDSDPGFTHSNPILQPAISSMSIMADARSSTSGFTHSNPILQPAISSLSIMADARSSTSEWISPSNWLDETLMRRTVDETMNSTWSLCWIRNDKPIQVQIWIERGTLIQKNWIVLEPRLMWRPVGSAPCVPESSIRLLQVHRIQESGRAPTCAPRMCRASTSFMVRTIQKETFWFQAATAMERDAIVHEWKVAIARLATLAVLDDTETLLKEFFLTKEKDKWY
jgi:hypothetical protein